MDDEMTVEENKQPETLPESEPSKEAIEPPEADGEYLSFTFLCFATFTKGNKTGFLKLSLIRN